MLKKESLILLKDRLDSMINAFDQPQGPSAIRREHQEPMGPSSKPFTEQISDEELVSGITKADGAIGWEMNNRIAFKRHLVSVAQREWGGPLFMCGRNAGFKKRWGKLSEGNKEKMIDDLLQELLDESTEDFVLKGSYLTDCSIFWYKHKQNNAHVTFIVDCTASELRFHMFCVREYFSDSIKQIYNECMKQDLKMAREIEPNHLDTIINTCTKGGEFSFQQSSYTTAVSLFRSFLRNFHEKRTPSSEERKFHATHGDGLGKEERIFRFTYGMPESGVPLNHDLHKFELESNLAKFTRSSEHAGCTEYDHDVYRIKIDQAPLYFNAIYMGVQLSLRFWTYSYTGVFGHSRRHYCTHVSVGRFKP